MCPAARSKSEVLSYASWDGKKVEGERGSFQGRKATQFAGDVAGPGGGGARGRLGPAGPEQGSGSAEGGGFK